MESAGQGMVDGYDIIGDIHGHGDALQALLQRLGYHLRHGAFTHPQRCAVFVGDLIDRGSQNRMVVDTVAAMVDAGSALAVMGNHEFNAWAFHYEDSRYDWLRPRSNKNLAQHIAFLHEYMDPRRPDRERELNAAVDFFARLPIYLDLGELRVIHACWHPVHLDALEGALQRDRRANHDLLVAAHRPGSEAFEHLEILLKGPELALPESHHYVDGNGTRRNRVRTRWWVNQARSLHELALVPGDQLGQLPDRPIATRELVGYPADDPPVFFGHYWRTGEPRPIADNVACVDYSMGLGEKLVAYRWSGESRLRAGNFVWVRG